MPAIQTTAETELAELIIAAVNLEGVRPADIEKIDPALADSVWKAGFRVRIAGSKEDAIAMDDADPAVI